MNPQDNDPLHAAINAGLDAIVEASATPPTWRDAWTALGPTSTEEERLAVYQAVRDSGCLPAEAGFYLVSWQIDAIAALEAESQLRPIEEQMAAIQALHGRQDDEPWPLGEEPEAYAELHRQHLAAWDELFAAALERFGEREIAEQFRRDPDEFERRSSVGQAFFHGPSDAEEPDAPEWLYSLAETVGDCVESPTGPGRMGLRFREHDEGWDLIMYPTPVELVGGAVDGEVVTPSITLDIERFRTAFDRIDACTWQSLDFPYGDGTSVWIEGSYQGHEVFVQMLAHAPEDEEPRMKVDMTQER